MRYRALPFSFLLLLATGAAFAQDDGQRVHRCAGRHGEVVFSGLPCIEANLAGTSMGTSDAAPPPADSCPASQEELRDRLGAAIARHDANTIAGMMHWRGVGGAAANERLRSLRELVRYPLLDLASGDGLHVRTGSNTTGGVRDHSFGIEEDAGCWWLTW
ncbi:hypothetical protein [Dokdonella sp.]|uniref:hypothetical protein n=1 Tax=Dokdonella sp. TaxID=2291710 RepID=UPI003784E366